LSIIPTSVNSFWIFTKSSNFFSRFFFRTTTTTTIK